MDNLKFTDDELQEFHALKVKAERVFDKYKAYQKKFGVLKGNVFDGGFYWEFDYTKMTNEEKNECKELENQMKVASVLLGLKK